MKPSDQDPHCLPLGGGYSDIFIHTQAWPIFFLSGGGFRKNENILGDMKILRIF